MLTKKKVSLSIKELFEKIPTGDQIKVIQHLAAFALSKKPNPLYLLKGYAGTGKTSLISAFVKMLANNNTKFVLMAPTGRAAKVLLQYTGFVTYTIHRRIYKVVADSNGFTRLIATQNRLKNAFFIVDEASMISDTQHESIMFSSRNNLLDDLMQYVFADSSNKLLLVGDTAQLPPVGIDISPALNIKYLQLAYMLTAYSFEMKEVMRQSLNSGILFSATILRTKIAQDDISLPFFHSKVFKKDVEVIGRADEFEEYLQQAFNNGNDEESVIVCRSNKRANLFNKQVREKILLRETELEAGDKLMIVKNNYYWLDEDSKAGFIANGDIAEIVRVIKVEELYGFRFAETDIRLIDYPEMEEFTVKLLLDTIYYSGPSLSDENYQKLHSEIEKEYSNIPSKRKRQTKISENPYFNALQVKFAYAMTCHKTQGGQWPYVFIDQGYVSQDMINIEFLRWLYTAFTRATHKVFLINFDQEFFLKETE